MSRRDDPFLGLVTIVLIVSVLNILLRKHSRHIICHCIRVFDLQSNRDEFNTAPNANTELLRDDHLFDCGSKIAC